VDIRGKRKLVPNLKYTPRAPGVLCQGQRWIIIEVERSYTLEGICKDVKPRFKTAQVWRGSRWIAIKLLMLWVLGENPSRSFYERLGGRLIGEQEKRLGEDVSAVEVAFGWPAIESLCGQG